jgi:hypothetical protein
MAPRRPVARWLALIGLVLLAVTLLAAPTAMGHRHDGLGLYDSDCPLVALATADRPGDLTISAASAPLVVATAIAVVSLVVSPAVALPAGVRFRAPPLR